MVRRVALAILALALVLRVAADYVPYTFLHADGTFYANVNRSLTQNVTFRQDDLTARSWYFDDLGWNRSLGQDWSNVALGVDGGLYPKHPVLMPLVAEPLFLALGSDGLLVFNVLALLLAAWLALALLDPTQQRPFVALAVAATCLSPVVVHYAYGYSNDVFSAVPLLAGMLALARGRPGLAGMALAGVIWARPAQALWVLAVAAPYVARCVRGAAWRDLGRLALGLGAVLAVPAGLQWAWFGSPFVTGYDRIVVREAGVMALDSARAAFDWPGWADVTRVLVYDEQSFVRGFPFLALVPLGWLAQAWRGKAGEAASSALVLGGTTLVYAAYAYPSSRFLIPLVAFQAAPLAELLEVLAEGGRRGWDLVARGWNGRARSGLAVGLVVLAALALGAGLRLAVPRADASLAEGVRVSTLDGRACDFWNLKWRRWECSHVDRGAPDMVGAPLAGECELSGGRWVRVPTAGPFGGKALEAASPVGASALEWEVASDPSARPRAAVQLRVTGLATTARVTVAPDAGASTLRAPLAAGRGPVRFEVPALAPEARSEAVCLRWRFL